ncbi:LysR family transcriptional regulator [Propionibacteriaceae bacterium Y1923]|uniref:LysR family transcriptional regulator n=1 Tax=Aestuariimicrobium sp. Y1814 TaxID=3418742 RepID=UPI003C29541F
MQIHQLEYFLAVASERSFTHAADQVRVVQSAVSAGIKQLEEDLGMPLFERRNRDVRLTAAGEALLPLARQVIDDLRAAREAVDAVRGTVRGSVVLGTIMHMGKVDLTGVLSTLAADYPDVVVKLRQTIQGTRTSLEEVRAGTLDLALVSAGEPSLRGFEYVELYAEPMVFVCPGGHRLDGLAVVDPREAAAEPFVSFPEGWGNRTEFERALHALGLTRTIRTEVVSFTLAAELVQAGLGVAVLPVSATVDLPGVHVAPLAGLDLAWRIQLVWSPARPLSAAATVLVEAFCQRTGD